MFSFFVVFGFSKVSRDSSSRIFTGFFFCCCVVFLLFQVFLSCFLKKSLRTLTSSRVWPWDLGFGKGRRLEIQRFSGEGPPQTSKQLPIGGFEGRLCTE